MTDWNNILLDLKKYDELFHDDKFRSSLNGNSFEFLLNKAIESFQFNAEELINSHEECIAIWQIKDDFSHDFGFESPGRLMKLGLITDISDITKDKYNLIYIDKEYTENLEEVYLKFTSQHEKGFLGHSLSVGDVITTRKDGINKDFICDSVGFTELDNFHLQLAQDKGISIDVNELAKEVVEITGFNWTIDNVTEDLNKGELIQPLINSVFYEKMSEIDIVEELRKQDSEDPAIGFYTDRVNELEYLVTKLCNYYEEFQDNYTDEALLNDIVTILTDSGYTPKEEVEKKIKERLDNKDFDYLLDKLEETEDMVGEPHIKSCFVNNQIINRKEIMEEKSLSFTKDSLKNDLAEKKAAEKAAPVRPGHEKKQEQSK